MYHIVTIWRVPPQLINQKMSFWLMGSIHTANLGIAGIALTTSNRRNPNHHWIANPQRCLDLLKEAPKIRDMFWIDSPSSGFPVRKINFIYIIHTQYVYIYIQTPNVCHSARSWPRPHSGVKPRYFLGRFDDGFWTKPQGSLCLWLFNGLVNKHRPWK